MFHTMRQNTDGFRGFGAASQYLPAGSSVRWQATIKGNAESDYYANYGQLDASALADLAEGALWQAIYSAQNIQVQASDGWFTDTLYVDVTTGIDWNTSDLQGVIESAVSQVFWFDPSSVFYQVTYVPATSKGPSQPQTQNTAQAGNVIQTYSNGAQSNANVANAVNCPKGQHFSKSQGKCVDDCAWYDLLCWGDVKPGESFLAGAGGALGLLAIVVIGAVVLKKA